MKSAGNKKGLPPIAVVSVSGIFPGAGQTQAFLDNILELKSAVIRVPEGRWPAPPRTMVSKGHEPGRILPDRALSDRAGLITNFSFDPKGFRVAPDILAALDPVHHLVLDAGRQAFESCYTNDDLKKRTGVILAAISLPTDTASAISRDILTRQDLAPLTSLDAARASVVSGPGAILARAMGFEGGSYTLDAACASSLFSLKLACEYLALKKADIMVAGGVSRPDSLYTQVGFSQLMALSPSGRCAPFDCHADGLVVGEGCGIVVLKRLEDALECGDTILGIIRGAGVSNDIEGNLVGPATEGQVRAMTGAYASARWTPDQIQYMECHGTGTPVGDQVEAASIREMLNTFQCPDTPLAIGSVKSMIGHLLTGAGAASFIKTLLAMNQKTIPPSLNFSAFPDKSPLARTRVRVQTRPGPWDPQGPGQARKAGISAFGFGGINAHVLVEEFKPEVQGHFVPAQFKAKTTLPCAIIGMNLITRNCRDLNDFSDLLAGKKSPRPQSPGPRWHRTDLLDNQDKNQQALFIEDFALSPREFHIPPNQMDDILAQHIILLKAVKGALEDAGIPPRPKGKFSRTHMGCAIGIDFDFNAANFFLRWGLDGSGQNDPKRLDGLSPPLTFNRTLGALGGIVASRTAREFQLGGPCFTLSAQAASGIKSVEIALDSLSTGETTTFICGCVDMAGDLRQYLLNQAAQPFEETFPAEGACAIVLKPLKEALKDQDRIYGIIQGTGAAGGSRIPGEKPSTPQTMTNTYLASLDRALAGTATRKSQIDFVQTHSDGTGPMGQSETRALDQAFPDQSHYICLNSAWPLIGDTRAASGLMSVIHLALNLFRRSFPGLPLPKTSGFSSLARDRFSPGDQVEAWEPDPGCPKKGLASAMTWDGTCAHLVMEEPPQRLSDPPAFFRELTRGDEPCVLVRTAPTALTRETLESLRASALENTSPNSLPKNFGKTPWPDHLPDPGSIARGTRATAKAHEKFLEFSSVHMKTMTAQMTELASLGTGQGRQTQSHEKQLPPLLDRDKCLEFAVGKAGRVLGPEFDIIDTYPVRVRLPAEPLMLVDRIMDITGEIRSLGPGKIVTQHDVRENAWYLDGGKAPVSISIEAGQADLFLCAYLGIDHAVKGLRKYRLLDAKVTFHRELPRPGEIIEYHIEIDRFLKQGEIYLFFFHYDGFINQAPFISMRDGCAGFFTEEEVENSGGIILTREDLEKQIPKKGFTPLTPAPPGSFSDEQVQSLRQGDLEKAFGRTFEGITLGMNQRLPKGRMHLIDRVLEFNPKGGRYGLGAITAEADIRPDAWFLTCHFVDDMVMPGTLMYECCAHALRILVQRMGWVSPDHHVRFEVLPGNPSDLKCRGPVTPATKKARYEIEIKELGYNPEPYVIADAHMFSDDLRIVLYRDMGMRLWGITRQDLERFWRKP